MPIDPADLQLPSADELLASAPPDEGGKALTGPHPMDNREYEFNLDFVDRRKKRWSGTFRSQILSIRQERARGILAAKMAGGVPFESLDPVTQNVNHMLAHLAMSLTLRPPWAEKIEELVELDVLQAIYAEVQAHVAHYFRIVTDQEESDGS